MPLHTNSNDADKPGSEDVSFDHFTFEELQDPLLDEMEKESDSFEEKFSFNEGKQEDRENREESTQDFSNADDFDTEKASTHIQDHAFENNTEIKSSLMVLKNALEEIRAKLDTSLNLIKAELGPTEDPSLSGEYDYTSDSVLFSSSHNIPKPLNIMREGFSGKDRVVEGVFDGQYMVGSDGNQYAIAQNYASKSKLVEGDHLKLTITSRGSFIYKQIGPVERIRVVGHLEHDPSVRVYYVRKDNRRWCVLNASITYFRGDSGDEVVLIIPRDRASSWGAVENIIKKQASTG